MWLWFPPRFLQGWNIYSFNFEPLNSFERFQCDTYCYFGLKLGFYPLSYPDESLVPEKYYLYRVTKYGETINDGLLQVTSFSSTYFHWFWSVYQWIWIESEGAVCKIGCTFSVLSGPSLSGQVGMWSSKWVTTDTVRFSFGSLEIFFFLRVIYTLLYPVICWKDFMDCLRTGRLPEPIRTRSLEAVKVKDSFTIPVQTRGPNK